MAAKATLEIGQELVAPYKGETFTAKVEDREGKTVVVMIHGNDYAPKGMVFTSLSAAGQALTQKKACQGPRFWHLGQAEDRGSNAAELISKAVEAGAPARKPAEAKAKKLDGFKNISRTPNQKGVGEGQTRWFCSSCMRSFVSEEPSPQSCPEGHAAIITDLTSVS